VLSRFRKASVRIDRSRANVAVLLLLLTAGAFLVQGYHPYAEDSEIYLPGVERLLQPTLFPIGQEFFQSHARLTLFPNLVAFSIRATHIRLEVGLLAWHLASIFLLLLACWELAGVLFSPSRARWCAVALVAVSLATPVAGTALFVVDQYLNPRNLAAFAAVFAVTRTLERKYLRAFLWLVFAASVHPLMWVFPFSFCALWLAMERFEAAREVWSTLKASAVMPAGVIASVPLLVGTPAAYHEAAKRHAYFFVQRWAWYEWLGVVAPLLLLWWLGRIGPRNGVRARACRAFAWYGVIYLAVSLALDLPARFESLARLQPMRSLLLLYIFLFVAMGGLVGEYVLKDRAWRWLVLFVPLAVGMFAAGRSLFPQSAHIEWPGRAAKNPWAQAFVWVRANTPVDAVFALDPEYMHVTGEDAIGFRCLAQRSRLADAVKDNGVVSMFPALADEWWKQFQAQQRWAEFQASDFSRLKEKYGVSWVILQQAGASLADCPYENSAVKVCRVQ
jgi:hypothetical protein